VRLPPPDVPGPLGRVLALSPHCDDAVLGCGDVLARHPGAVVVTFFAGAPPAGTGLTEWDAAAGFGPGDDVAAARRREDRAALACLGATAAWLDFLDDQYGEPPTTEALQEALVTAVATTAPDAVMAPLGLFHRDHRRLADATLAAATHDRGRRWLLWGDALYRRYAGLLAERLAALRDAGVAVVPVALDGRSASPRKRAAIACYASQLRALGTPGRPGTADALAEETLWEVRPA